MASSTDYIKHHLTYLNFNVKDMQFGNTGGFWTINLDTVFFSVLLGVIVCTLMFLGARKVKTSAPGKIQNFAEMMLEFADGQVKDCFHGKNNLMAQWLSRYLCGFC